MFESHNLDLRLRLSNTLKFKRPSSNSVDNCNKPRGSFLITRLRLGLTHLRELRLKHDFRRYVKSVVYLLNDAEST